MRVGNVLKSRILAASVAVALLSGGCASVDTSKDWVDIKDPKELRALYSDKTFKGWIMYDYFRPWVGHYRADGHGIFLHEGRRYPLTWAVKGDDQVCTESAIASRCYRYQRHLTRAGTYRSTNIANNQVGEFTVEDGVPKF